MRVFGRSLLFYDDSGTRVIFEKAEGSRVIDVPGEAIDEPVERLGRASAATEARFVGAGRKAVET